MTTVIISTCNTIRWPEFAGSTWVRLQYLLGLKKLGVRAFWVEHLDTIDRLKHPHSLQYLASRFDQTACEFGFSGDYCIVYNSGEQYLGMPNNMLKSVAADADLVLSISGSLPSESPLIKSPNRAYVDVDPGFTQIWAHQTDMGFDRHNLFLTVGQNVRGADFPIPAVQGIEWIPFIPPVVLDQWPPKMDQKYQRISTIADWRGSQEAIFDGEYYGTKRREFVRMLNVPEKAGCRIELALTIGQKDFEDVGLLDGHNWCIRDPYLYAGDPRAYREFIQNSRMEFSVAKNGYVKSRSGWISDRTACYLASGKPAIVQSTGYEPYLYTGEGLLTYTTEEEAADCIRRVNEDYLAHCQAARDIAERYFDSDKVLAGLLGKAGLAI